MMLLLVVASLGWQSGHCEPVLSLTATTVKDATVIQGSLSLSFALLSLTVFLSSQISRFMASHFKSCL